MTSRRMALEKKLLELSPLLEEKYIENTELGAMTGISGVALFFFYNSRLQENEEQAALGVQVIEEVINRINNGYTFPSYCTGIAGACWVIEVLAESDFMDTDTDELLPHFDQYLHRNMMSSIHTGHYDIMHGALGYGFYFLKRYENTHSQTLRAQYKGYLEQLIKALNSLAENDEQGLKWRSVVNVETKTEGYNLSLSHGMASIINFLSRLYVHADFEGTIKHMLTGAISFVWAQEISTGTASFPNLIATSSQAPQNSRLSWCYGDLGIGLSILKAAEVLQDDELKVRTINMLLKTTKRKEIVECGIRDASPCHGAFGLVQIYLFLFLKTGVSDFEMAADYWVDIGLQLAEHSDGLAGYRQFSLNGWNNRLDVLEGIAGIGLSIITYLSREDNTWDELLFIS